MAIGQAYPESVDILVSFERDKDGKLTACKIYDGKGNRIGFTQTLLQDNMPDKGNSDDLFGSAGDLTSSGTFKVQLYIKDTVNYIKKEINK